MWDLEAKALESKVSEMPAGGDVRYAICWHEPKRWPENVVAESGKTQTPIMAARVAHRDKTKA